MTTMLSDRRYLFQLAQFNISEIDHARVSGFRHGYSLGIAQENPQTGALFCPCCELPKVPFGGEDICACPCDLCADELDDDTEDDDDSEE